MKRIIIDSNIILSDPELLAQKPTNAKLIIPDLVLKEIRNIDAHGRFPSDLLEIIYKSAGEDYIEIIDTISFLEQKEQKMYGRNSDVDFIKFCKSYKKLFPETLIATDDRALNVYAKENNLEVINSSSLKNKWFTDPVKSERLSDEIKNLSKRFNRRLVLSFIAGIMFTLTIISAFYLSDFIISYFNIWGTILLFMVIGLLSFYARSKWSLMYGIVEFLVGLFASLVSFLPDFNFESIEYKPTIFITILAGIYIMVRGLSNIEKGIQATSIEYYWNILFRKK